jgi:hypothetical protein
MPHGIFHHPLDLTGSGLGIHHLTDVGVFSQAEGDEVFFLGVLKEILKFLLIIWLGFDVEHLSVLLDMVGQFVICQGVNPFQVRGT